MFHHEIKYEDFNEKPRTDDLYFNLSRAEIFRIELSIEGGLEAYLPALLKKPNNGQEMFAFFERMILASYGVKSEDDLHFDKSEKVRDLFQQSAAYNALIEEMLSNAGFAGDFINGIMPREIREEVAREAAQKAAEDKKTLEDKKEPTTAELAAAQAQEDSPEVL